MNRRGFLRFLAAAPLAATLAPALPTLETVPIAAAVPITAGVITSITLINAGSGYTSPPTIVMA